ncbi:hypothetical protein LCGC14_1621240 [marine sediment metagenome]|uniref:Uncharacterized protein n=1 Tax=marine sediment metagenome TaxID=412755 RepID=A0A0F9I5F6_9ZZZZ
MPFKSGGRRVDNKSEMKQDAASMKGALAVSQGVVVGLGTNTAVQFYCFLCGKLIQVGKGSGFVVNKANGHLYLGPCTDCLKHHRVSARAIAEMVGHVESEPPESPSSRASGGSGTGPC